MKRLWTLFLLAALVFCLAPVMAQPATNDDGDDDLVGPPGLEKGAKKEMSAEKMIARMHNRKEKMLANLRKRFETLPQRLEKISGRADRLGQRVKKGREGKGAGIGEAGASGAAPDRAAEAKKRITEKYEMFKSRLGKRKDLFLEKSKERQAKLKERISSMKPDDQAKVMAEFETTQKEIGSELEKLVGEAQKKLEETFQRILAKLN